MKRTFVRMAQQWAPEVHTACRVRWALEDRLDITRSMISFDERLNDPTFLSQKNKLGCLETTENAPMALPSFLGRTAGVWRGLPRWWTLSKHHISHQHPNTMVRLPKQRPYGKKRSMQPSHAPTFCSGGGGYLRTNKRRWSEFPWTNWRQILFRHRRTTRVVLSISKAVCSCAAFQHDRVYLYR